MTIIAYHDGVVYSDHTSVQFGATHNATKHVFERKLFENKALYNKDRSLVCLKSGLCHGERASRALVHFAELIFVPFSIKALSAEFIRNPGRPVELEQLDLSNVAPGVVNFTVAMSKEAAAKTFDTLHTELTSFLHQLVIVTKTACLSATFIRRVKKENAKSPADIWFFNVENHTGQPVRLFGSAAPLVSDLVMAGYTVEQAVRLSTRYHGYGHDYGVSIIDTKELTPFNPRSVRLPRLNPQKGNSV